MKLCRFELLSDPGVVRSGIVYSGKIYETDGVNSKGVHEAAAVRPLPPIGVPPSMRIYRAPTRIGEELTDDEVELLPYFYGNPGSLVGASQIIPKPDYAVDLRCEAYIAAVIVQETFRASVETADDAILGYTIMLQFVAANVLQASNSARAYDFITAIGPVLTTPDEVDGFAASIDRGKRHNLELVHRVNGIERSRANLYDLPITFAQAISVCSQAVPLRAGDLIAIGPLATWSDDDPPLEAGDEVQVAVDNLGTLTSKIAPESTELD